MKQDTASPEEIVALRQLVARMGTLRGSWGEWKGRGRTGENTFTMPFVVFSNVVRDAMWFLYDHDLIIRFNWHKWDEGRAIFRRTNEDRFASLDRITVLKLLTAVARQDRFVEGAWVGIFEDGSAQLLFRRLLEIEIDAN